MASFAAFSTAYGMAMGCVESTAPRFKWIAQIGPLLKQGEPILQAVPEYGEDKAMVSSLTGRIELNHVTFRYEQDSPAVIDDLSQKIVTESLDSLDSTRIVIAHRLSTIRSCDRIIALNKGKIVESGSYDELIEKGGFFAELVRRQQIDEG